MDASGCGVRAGGRDESARARPAHVLPLQVQCAGCAHSVRVALTRITGALRRSGLCDEQVERAQTALAEVLNNVVEHAGASRREDAILIRVSQGPGGLRLRVCDDGAPMPGGMLPPGLPVPLDCPTADLPEGGFGWFLIRQLVRDLGYRRCQGRNMLKFRLPLTAEDGGPDAAKTPQ